jgi:predicted ATP-binding protein involved in virulence
MKLKNLQISNFRCFEYLSVDLDEQLTVLVAKNGQGKSTVLDAIRIGLWPFVSGFDLARNPASDSANNISIDDVRKLKMRDGQMARQLPCQITLEGNPAINLLENAIGHDFVDEFDLTGFSWTRFRDSEAKGTRTKDLDYSIVAKHLASKAQDLVRNPDSPDTALPVLGYYGTGRLWSQKRLTKAKKVTGKQNADFYMRLFAYRDCLDPASSYKHFADWFTWIFESYREDQIKQSEKGLQSEIDSVWTNTIQVVQQAIDSVLQETGWHSLEYSVSHGKSLVLNHDEYGTLKVELLSDGIRGVLAMVGDIAYRCIKLNPHLDLNAAKETRGVVMIDEIEMHLHPAWQQTILGNLCNAFPKIQFIVTTHSPQVISTVPGHQIRILDGNQVYSAEEGTQGAEASRILKEVFGVELRAQHLEIVKKLNRYLELIDDDQWDSEEALKLRQTLDEWSHGHEPELVKADIDIRMKAFQRQL